MASLNRNPTLQTSRELFEQIYTDVDKTDPGDTFYSYFVKGSEQLPYEAWKRIILLGKKMVLRG